VLAAQSACGRPCQPSFLHLALQSALYRFNCYSQYNGVQRMRGRGQQSTELMFVIDQNKVLHRDLVNLEGSGQP
jgi:hypothetical protein